MVRNQTSLFSGNLARAWKGPAPPRQDIDRRGQDRLESKRVAVISLLAAGILRDQSHGNRRATRRRDFVTGKGTQSALITSDNGSSIKSQNVQMTVESF